MRVGTAGLCLFLLARVTGLSAAGADSDHGALTPALHQVLEQAAAHERIPVIVRLADPLDAKGFSHRRLRPPGPGLVAALRCQASQNEKPVRSLLLDEPTDSIVSLWHINALALHAKPHLVRRLAASPDVCAISLDRTISRPETPTSAAPPAVTSHLDAINAPPLWALGFRGQTIVIAGMDTGVDYNHEALANWRGGPNSWFDPYGRHPLPYDYDGHGTGTMALAVGVAVNGQYLGAAPDAQWIAVKIFDDDNIATLSAIHHGYAWLLDPDGDPNTDDAPQVVNNSWGLDGSEGLCLDEFKDDIQVLNAAGICVVFAAGNSGPYPGSALSPASCPGVLAVGATDNTGQVVWFSSRGPSPCPDANFPSVIAPGLEVLTADLTFGVFPQALTSATGTSFSSAQVAGGIALLRHAFPWASPEDVNDALRCSALDLGQPGPDNDAGFGAVDLTAAYYSLRNQLPAADLDHDRDVDLADLVHFTAQWLRDDCTPTSPCRADLNLDGRVDLTDYAFFAAVPETR